MNGEQQEMQYAMYGDGDLEVSRVCLGTMAFGTQNSEAEARRQLDFALDEGTSAAIKGLLAALAEFVGDGRVRWSGCPARRRGAGCFPASGPASAIAIRRSELLGLNHFLPAALAALAFNAASSS